VDARNQHSTGHCKSGFEMVVVVIKKHNVYL